MSTFCSATRLRTPLLSIRDVYGVSSFPTNRLRRWQLLPNLSSNSEPEMTKCHWTAESTASHLAIALLVKGQYNKDTAAYRNPIATTPDRARLHLSVEVAISKTKKREP